MRFFLLICSILLIVSRLLWLSADPPSFISSSIVGDEGYWVHNARLHTLFNQAFTDDFAEDVTIAPLLSLFLRLSFSLFGVGFWQARLIPALFGIFSFFLLFILIKKLNQGYPKFIPLLLLASSPLFFGLNRLVMGESVAIFFTLASLLFLVKQKNILSGFSWGLAILAKTNAIFIGLSMILIAIFDKKTTYRQLITIFVSSLVLVFVSFFIIQLVTGVSVTKTYLHISGTDYLLTSSHQVILNLKSFVKNTIWFRHYFWVLIIALIFPLSQSFLHRQFSQSFIIGFSLILGQILTIAPISNQGSDHRFAFLLLGVIILASSIKKSRFFVLLSSFLILWQSFFIFNYFRHRTFTLRNQSRFLGELSQPGQIITGFFSHQLSLENQLYPLYWAPDHNKFSRINSKLALELKPSFVLESLIIDGRDGRVFTSPDHLSLGEKQSIISHLKILPFNLGYQAELNLRQVLW